MNEQQFVEEMKKIDIEITPLHLQQLKKYYEMLVEKNKVMNLTNIIEHDDVYLKHFYDSLTICNVCNLMEIENMCDVGTGAGFPGIVIKIIFPHVHVVLIDSLDKRIKFLNEVISELGLTSIEAFHMRAEEYANSSRETFDLVTSRAVAKLSVLTELCIPLLKKGGLFIAMKAHAEEELSHIQKNLNKLGSEIVEIKQFNLPFEESIRTLIKIKKNQKTEEKYPRI